MISKINKIYFFNKILNFRNSINKKIEKITGIEDGLELNSNNIIKPNNIIFLLLIIIFKTIYTLEITRNV